MKPILDELTELTCVDFLFIPKHNFSDFSASEGKIRTLHFLTFAGVRIVGGFIALRRILTVEEIVKDTSYICSILLLYAMALYLFAGVISFTTKRMTRTCEGFVANRNFPMVIMTSVSDDWLY